MLDDCAVILGESLENSETLLSVITTTNFTAVTPQIVIQLSYFSSETNPGCKLDQITTDI